MSLLSRGHIVLLLLGELSVFSGGVWISVAKAPRSAAWVHWQTQVWTRAEMHLCLPTDVLRKLNLRMHNAQQGTAAPTWAALQHVCRRQILEDSRWERGKGRGTEHITAWGSTRWILRLLAPIFLFLREKDGKNKLGLIFLPLNWTVQ